MNFHFALFLTENIPPYYIYQTSRIKVAAWNIYMVELRVTKVHSNKFATRYIGVLQNYTWKVLAIKVKLYLV